MSLLFKDFQDYIKDLCTKNKLVQHGVNGRKSFFRMDGEEALAAIPNNAASPYVVVTDFSGSPIGEGERLEQYAELQFISRARAKKANLSDEIERAQQQAYDIMMQFVARIKEDYEADDGCGPVQNLKPENIRFDPIGPVNQLGYGWALTLPFSTNMPGYDPAKWNA